MSTQFLYFWFLNFIRLHNKCAHHMAISHTRSSSCGSFFFSPLRKTQPPPFIFHNSMLTESTLTHSLTQVHPCKHTSAQSFQFAHFTLMCSKIEKFLFAKVKVVVANQYLQTKLKLKTRCKKIRLMMTKIHKHGRDYFEWTFWRFASCFKLHQEMYSVQKSHFGPVKLKRNSSTTTANLL